MQTLERLTALETARRLGVRVATVYELVFDGELPGEPDHNGTVWIPLAAVRRYEDRQAPRSD